MTNKNSIRMQQPKKKLERKIHFFILNQRLQ